MGFIAPWFLAGLVVAGLPLWLHLLRQFKRTPQPFSSLMFFERRVQSSTRHRRLRYLALLSLRLLLLVMLVLAFANPFVSRVLASGNKHSVTVIAMDRSFSMHAGDRMAQAKAGARKVLRGLGGGDMAQVIAFDNHVEALTGVESGRGELEAAVETLQAGDLPSSYGELARALRVMAEAKGTQLNVHLFSDMQQSSMPASFRDLTLGPGATLELHPLNGGTRANWAVESVHTASRVFEAKHTKLDATVAGWQTEAAARKVSLILDGKVIALKDVTVPANGRVPVEFLGFEVPYGTHRGTVQIEPQDALPQDDRFDFSVEHQDARPVLFLYAGGRARSGFYYKAALESASETGLRLETFPVEQMHDRPLAPYAFVVLNDVGELDAQTNQKICDWVQRGGAALVVAGPATLRAGRLPLSNLHITAIGQTQGIGAVDDQNPAMAGGGHFQNVQFFGGTRVALKPDARVVARLADGTPLLSVLNAGEGRELVFASTLDNSSNDFPLHASFLPFVAQTARFLSGMEETNASAVAGTPLALRKASSERTSIDVVGPDGRHQLSLDQATRALSFDLLQDGFYEISRAGGQRRLVAVHADRRESDLTAVPAETLDLWRNTGSAAAGKTISAVGEVQPMPFWRYFLVLALLAALVESIFASRYLKRERQLA